MLWNKACSVEYFDWRVMNNVIRMNAYLEAIFRSNNWRIERIIMWPLGSKQRVITMFFRQPITTTITITITIIIEYISCFCCFSVKYCLWKAWVRYHHVDKCLKYTMQTMNSCNAGNAASTYNTNKLYNTDNFYNVDNLGKSLPYGQFLCTIKPFFAH